MSETSVLTLPVLPLNTGVVLPQMVVTVALETPEAIAAVDAAVDRTLLLVPRVDGKYGSVGTVARIEDAGELRGGLRALVIRGVHRAVIGAGVPGTGSALWVRAEPAIEANGDSDRSHELSDEYKATVENILDARGISGMADALRGVHEPSAVADMAGYSPDLTVEQKIEVLETLDVERRLELVAGWARKTLAEIAHKERNRS
ncbi:MAG: LON peptidase substrate-binding domain-containing protein, partial [Microthrixaceae bacterium]